MWGHRGQEKGQCGGQGKGQYRSQQSVGVNREVIVAIKGEVSVGVMGQVSVSGQRRGQTTCVRGNCRWLREQLQVFVTVVTDYGSNYRCL